MKIVSLSLDDKGWLYNSTILGGVGTFLGARASFILEVNVKDDAQLIDDCLTGESAAFGRLVEKYQDRLYNTLVHVLNSKEDARDITQDAFVQAYVKLHTFQHNSAFYTWLYRIAFNLAISLRRKRRPTVSVEYTTEKTGIEPVDDHQGPEDQLETADQVKLVHEALAKLSEDHRTILVLRELQEHSYETIGQMLNLPVGTVRSRIHRARLQLRDQLTEMMQDEI